MLVLRSTPFEFGFVTWRIQPPRDSLVVVIKATFDIVPDGECTIAEEQRSCAGEVYYDDDTERSVRYDTDFAILKLRGECHLVGTCHPPNGAPTTATTVAFMVGRVQKQFAVIGDRFWMPNGVPSRPEPFTSMPLLYERAFGGPSFAKNPVGAGIAEVDTPAGKRKMLPNLEDSQRLITATSQRPEPVGAFPVPRTWASRIECAGTYDKRWLTTRWPWFPEDFDYGYFNTAPPDQQIEGYWRGDEEIAMQHLRPEAAVVRTRLPGLRARAFLHVMENGNEDLREIPTELDTIVLDADANQVVCLWRGHIDVSSDTMPEVLRLFYLHESLDEAQPPNMYRALFARKLLEEREEEEEFEPAEPEDASTAELARSAMTDEDRAEFEAETGMDPSALLEPPANPPSKAEEVASAREGLEATREVIEAAGGTPGPGFAEMEAQLAALEKDDDGGQTDKREDVRARHGRGESCAEMDLEGVDLSELDLRGADFSRALLARSKFNHAMLEGANFEGAILESADFTGADATRANFEDAVMADVVAERAILDEAVLDGAEAERVKLTDARLQRVSASGAEFAEGVFDRADFSDAKLDTADFSRARAEAGVFARASMVDTWADGLAAPGADFSNADLTKLRASEASDFTRALLKNVKAAGARFRGAQMNHADLSFSEFSGADFSDATLIQANLNACVFKKGRFLRAQLVGATALRSDFYEANFEAADLSHADLRGASLYGAEFWRAKTEGAQLDLADVTMTKLEGTR